MYQHQTVFSEIQTLERQETYQYEIKIAVVIDDIQRDIHDLLQYKQCFNG